MHLKDQNIILCDCELHSCFDECSRLDQMKKADLE